MPEHRQTLRLISAGSHPASVAKSVGRCQSCEIGVAGNVGFDQHDTDKAFRDERNATDALAGRRATRRGTRASARPLTHHLQPVRWLLNRQPSPSKFWCRTSTSRVHHVSIHKG